jgi:SAM-dependent methyltransferase
MHLPSLALDALLCGQCGGPLDAMDLHLQCSQCESRFSTKGPYLDMGAPTLVPEGIGPAMMHTPFLARVYERVWRPLFMTVSTRRRPAFHEEHAKARDALLSAQASAQLWVDLSCGPGLAGRQFCLEGSAQCVMGIDLSEAMLIECDRLARTANLAQMPLLRADVGHLPLKTESVDGIHAGACLHLWPDVPLGLAEAYRILKPGCAIAASTFVLDRGIMTRQSQKFFGRMTQTRFFRRHRLHGAFEDAGFRAVESTITGSVIFITARK